MRLTQTTKLAALVAVALLTIPASASTLLSEDFTGSTSFTGSNTVNAAGVWYSSNTGRWDLDTDADAARRSTGSPGSFTGIGYAWTGTAVTDAVEFAFSYTNSFESVSIEYALYGANLSSFGGGDNRIRTDGASAGANWTLLDSGTAVLATGSAQLGLLGDNIPVGGYTHIGIRIATTSLTSGGGSFFDITSVTLTQIPEPGSLGLLGLGALCLLGRRRR